MPCAKNELIGGKFPSGGGANPWWDPAGEGLCIWAAYQPRWAASLAASYTDLSGNGNNAGVGVAPTWDAVNGWKFNGTTQYLTTTFVPQNDQSQTGIVQYTNANMGFTTSWVFGTRDGTDLWGIRPVNVRYANGNKTDIAPGLAAGNLAVAGSQGYRNGVTDGGAIGAWGGVPVSATYIGCRNIAGAGDFLIVYIQALAIYDCTLTDPQVLAVATAMAAI